MSMLLLGILSSVFTEIVTALNHKLQGTLLQGKAALLLSMAIAIIGATLKEILTPNFTWHALGDWQTLLTTASTIWAISQAYFYVISSTLGLNFVPKTPVDPVQSV